MGTEIRLRVPACAPAEMKGGPRVCWRAVAWLALSDVCGFGGRQGEGRYPPTFELSYKPEGCLKFHRALSWPDIMLLMLWTWPTSLYCLLGLLSTAHSHLPPTKNGNVWWKQSEVVWSAIGRLLLIEAVFVVRMVPDSGLACFLFWPELGRVQPRRG